MWRPTKLNDTTVQKLYEAFKLWWTIEEACCYAEISRATYYEWIKENNEFSDKIALAKRYLEIKSRAVISDSLEKWDVKTAMWYLERKNKVEFSIKELVTNELKEYTIKQVLEEIQEWEVILDDEQKAKITNNIENSHLYDKSAIKRLELIIN